MLRTIANGLLIGGVLLLADVGATLAWQEPLTALYTWVQQNQLAGELNRLNDAPASAGEQEVLAALGDAANLRIAYLARELKRQAKEGSAVGRIRIRQINANYVIVKGTATADLVNGPGVYPQTPFPGAPGTVAIAGHRTTFLHPFRHIDKLHASDVIEIDMPYAKLFYRIEKLKTVLPGDLAVIKPVGYDRLVLSACTPPFSASHRLIVFAREYRAIPEGAARPYYFAWQRLVRF